MSAIRVNVTGDMTPIWNSVTTGENPVPVTLYAKRYTWTRLASNLGVCDKKAGD